MSARGVLFLLPFLLLGIWSRFAHLDRKPVWHDEAVTFLWVSGYDYNDLQRAVDQGRPVPIEDLARFRQARPQAHLRNVTEMVRTQDPHQSVLYAVGVYLWGRYIGDSVATVRALSAWAGVLAVVAVAWFAWELLRDRTAAALTLALVSVSPLHVIYAQEARVYSIWTAVVAASCAQLVIARRTGRRAAWLLYAVTVALGLYAQALFLLVVAAQWIYSVILDGPRAAQARRHLMWIALGAAPYAPVVLNLLHPGADLLKRTAWTAEAMPARIWLETVAGDFCSVFFDARMREHSPLGLLVVPIFVATAAAGYHTVRATPAALWLLPALLVVVPYLVLGVPDLLLGGGRLPVARYLLPSFVALQVVVASWLAAGLRTVRRTAFATCLAALLLCGVASVLVYARAPTCWVKSRDRYIYQLAEPLRAGPRPLVLSRNTLKLAALSFAVPAGVDVMLIDDESNTVPEDRQRLFLLGPGQLPKRLRARMELVEINALAQLWQLRPATAGTQGSADAFGSGVLTKPRLRVARVDRLAVQELD